jgi:hypothetical protein
MPTYLPALLQALDGALEQRHHGRIALVETLGNQTRSRDPGPT